MKNNPFTLTFGKEPERFVERMDTYTLITETFMDEAPYSNLFLITGVRGSGKTVLMSSIANELREKEEWIVATLNSSRDLLQMMAASLYDESKVQKHFIDAELNLSKFGIGVDFKKNQPISDIQIAVEKMVSILADKNKKILVTIDDITKNDNLIAFANAFQNMTGKNYPIFLLMTGLYENVYSIQTDKRCSFLLRAEKIALKPLNLIGMKNQYKQTFCIDEKQALEMAIATKGYSYAFQVIGYIMWEKECSLEEALPYFDERISEYCYQKIWEDCTNTERKILTELSVNGKMKVDEIIRAISGNKNSFGVIRDRMVKKGIVDGSERGYLALILPRFDVYVKFIQNI